MIGVIGVRCDSVWGGARALRCQSVGRHTQHYHDGVFWTDEEALDESTLHAEIRDCLALADDVEQAQGPSLELERLREAIMDAGVSFREALGGPSSPKE